MVGQVLRVLMAAAGSVAIYSWMWQVTRPMGAATTPPVQICGNAGILHGPVQAPAQAIVVPAGDNSTQNFQLAGQKYYFAPGVHMFRRQMDTAILTGEGAEYVGAPGAVLDGGGVVTRAFGGEANGVTVRYLTVRNFTAEGTIGAIDASGGTSWRVTNNSVVANVGLAVALGGGTELSYNCIKANGGRAFRLSMERNTAARQVLITRNEICGNGSKLEQARSELPIQAAVGLVEATNRVQIHWNYIHHNRLGGLSVTPGSGDIRVQYNYVSDNAGAGIWSEAGGSDAQTLNTVLRNEASHGAS